MFLNYLDNRHCRLVLECGAAEIDFYGEELGVLHELVALEVERGEVCHESAQLEDDVLHVFVVEELQLGQHVGAQACKSVPSIGATAKDETINMI